MNALMLSAEQTRLNARPKFLLGRVLASGTEEYGFYGEFSAAEVVSSSDLASAVGLSTGNTLWDTGSWLGFSHEGKRLLISKKPRRNFLSWDDLNSHDLIFGKPVYIKGQRFKCRVLTGANADPGSSPGREYSKFMTSILDITNGEFAKFTAVQLGISGAVWQDAPGRVTICQEKTLNLINCVLRGSMGQGPLAYLDMYATSAANESLGWRPVLELID